MRHRKNLAAAVAVLAFALFVFSDRGLAAPVALKPPKENVFDQFSAKEMKGFQQFRSGLRKKELEPADFEARMKEYGRKMIERYEAFRDSVQGIAYKLDANKEMIAIAIRVAEDPKVVDGVLKSEKDPERLFLLKLHAAQLYGQDEQPDAAKKLIEEVLAASKVKFPPVYREAEKVLFQVAPQGLPFPEFPADAKDLDGKDIRIADYKGKAVLVDFWAAWCGPCMEEMPNVVRTYNKYHPKGFEIVGISLDRAKADMLKAMKEKGVTWRQYFDGRGWESTVIQQYGIQAIPATYLVGPDGKVITNQTRGSKLEAELDNLLSAKK